MNSYGYGLWLLVIVNSAVFIIFAASFFHPHTKRDWKAMGAFSSFVVALMVEMYGPSPLRGRCCYVPPARDDWRTPASMPRSAIPRTSGSYCSGPPSRRC